MHQVIRNVNNVVGCTIVHARVKNVAGKTHTAKFAVPENKDSTLFSFFSQHTFSRTLTLGNINPNRPSTHSVVLLLLLLLLFLLLMSRLHISTLPSAPDSTTEEPRTPPSEPLTPVDPEEHKDQEELVVQTLTCNLCHKRISHPTFRQHYRTCMNEEKQSLHQFWSSLVDSFVKTRTVPLVPHVAQHFVLGSWEDVQRTDVSYTAVVTCCRQAHRRTTLHIPLCDDLSQDLDELFLDTEKNPLQALHRHIQDHPEALVLIHCQQGISRSATVLMIYLVKFLHWELGKAWLAVRQHRPQAYPNLYFFQQMCRRLDPHSKSLPLALVNTLHQNLYYCGDEV